MPNTLAHLGVQALLGRTVQPQADMKWILLGCVLPDLPWIIQTVGRSDFVSVNLIDLRLYALVQSSLLFCLILAVGVALVSRTPLRTFGTLAFAAVLHLLLDATQTKWGNGIFLVAPFDWTMLNFGWIWPEDWPSYALTVFGLVTLIILWWRVGPAPLQISRPPTARLCLSTVIIGLWIIGPLPFMTEAEARNLHNTQVLRSVDMREGVAFTADRNLVVNQPDGTVVLHSWAGEVFELQGEIPEGSTVISLQGEFIGADTVEVHAAHPHQDGPREWFSYLGLISVMAWWGHALWRGKKWSRIS